jgi:hypothetical protein
VLIRPDEHVAWVGDGSDHGPREVLAMWFGAPTPCLSLPSSGARVRRWRTPDDDVAWEGPGRNVVVQGADVRVVFQLQ